jgi:uncharacterized protein involved in type VI secretion and phage assembly
MPSSNYLSTPCIEIDNRDISAGLAGQIVSVEIDDNLWLPDMFTIFLHDPGFSLTDSKQFDLGKTVKVSARGDSGLVQLISGEITAIEPEYLSKGGNTLLVRGYNQSHRLHRVKKSKVYLQKTDKDIVQEVANECQLKVTMNSLENTPEVYATVVQSNETDMQFLQKRAKRIGYCMYVDNDVLYFRHAPESAKTTPVLEWGEKTLIDFQARLTAAEQVEEVIVRGWDPKTKKEIIGKANRPKDPPKVGEKRTGGEAVNQAFNIKSKEIIVDHPVATQAEADALAQSVLDERGHGFLQAEGLCLGNPEVRAGAMIEIKGVGKRFSGKYRVSRALHIFDVKGYTTRFTISGKRADTLSELLTPKNSNGKGLVVGTVTDNKDPEGLCRVKVMMPTLMGKDECIWARLAAPMAGGDRGMQFIPEVHDEVLVAFEHDDASRPYVIGALWNGKDKPPVKSDTLINGKGEVQQRIIRSRSGHVIILDDTQGDCKIKIIDSTGKNSVIIDSKNNSIELAAEGNISLKAKGDISLDSKGKLTMKGAGGAELESSASAEVKAAGNLDIKGATINLN